MKFFVTILTLLIAATVSGQTKDRRAELDIAGRVNEISVSPDEKIWLVTATGSTYYTDRIGSSWHYGKSLINNKDEYGTNNPHLERISFFNNDTAIMTGYISATINALKNNGYYLTKDAGKNWELLDYGGNSWIYTIYTDKNGNAWMGGLSKELYYSNNFGQSWTTIKLPYKSSDRTYGIYMVNTNSGIASSNHNELLTTEDNWKSVTYLKTPLDQKKYHEDELMGSVDNRISKILKWNDYIVVNQHGHIFYSATNYIDWKLFPIAIIDFELDINSNKLFAVTESLKIASFSSPTKFEKLSNNQLSGFPINIKAVNNSLYLVSYGNEVYKVNEKEWTHTFPYTTDKGIPEPHIVKQGTKLEWGINRNQIYLADINQHNWYREYVLDFSVADFKVLNDSEVIIWDGVQNNYRYSIHNHIPKLYFPDNPIKHFLESQVQWFSIKSGIQGCFQSSVNEVIYSKADDSTFATTTFSVNNNQGKDNSTFRNKVKSNILSNNLISIDSRPSAIPLLKDFQITEKDKNNYLTLVDNQLNSNGANNFSGKKQINKEFYYAVPATLDTLESSIVATILNQQEGLVSTTSRWITIQIVNQKYDTLSITRDYYESSLPWHLPWKFKYNGLYFNCYNIEFSRFINSCIPENFIGKEEFDNSILIMQIADYLYNKS